MLHFDNLFCSICKINDEVVRESYALDGKSEEESVRMIEDLIRLFFRRAANRVANGIVADSYAELRRSFHWDDFFVGRKRSPAEWPLVEKKGQGFKSRFDDAYVKGFVSWIENEVGGQPGKHGESCWPLAGQKEDCPPCKPRTDPVCPVCG